MGILSWIVLGGIAGWIASMFVNKTGEGPESNVARAVL